MVQYIVLSLLWFCKAATGHVWNQPGLNNNKLQEFLSAASVCRILGRRSITVSIRNDNSLSAFFSHKWLLRIHWCPVKMLMLILLLLLYTSVGAVVVCLRLYQTLGKIKVSYRNVCWCARTWWANNRKKDLFNYINFAVFYLFLFIF